jgi:hypothetical protein
MRCASNLDGIKTGRIIYRKMGDSFVLDIAHPPKYCPQCQENGLVTKVKKFRLKTENILVLMCKNDQVNLPLDALTRHVRPRIFLDP